MVRFNINWPKKPSYLKLFCAYYTVCFCGTCHTNDFLQILSWGEVFASLCKTVLSITANNNSRLDGNHPYVCQEQDSAGSWAGVWPLLTSGQIMGPGQVQLNGHTNRGNISVMILKWHYIFDIEEVKRTLAPESHDWVITILRSPVSSSDTPIHLQYKSYLMSQLLILLRLILSFLHLDT